jgi:nitrite reductase/ring-hydroxylating ferredoxin subunit
MVVARLGHPPSPGVRAALEALEAGSASALVVAKLDRLSRSMLDFAKVMAAAQRQSWALVALDVAVDTTTPAGEAKANVMATYAQFERRLIGQRTREALAVKCAAVLVTRSTSGDICAIANTCSHFGGPLAQGEREGDVVVCPWHGSRFDVCTGDVVGGPVVGAG